MVTTSRVPHLIGHIRMHVVETAPTDDFSFMIDLILDRLAAGR